MAENWHFYAFVVLVLAAFGFAFLNSNSISSQYNAKSFSLTQPAPTASLNLVTLTPSQDAILQSNLVSAYPVGAMTVEGNTKTQLYRATLNDGSGGTTLVTYGITCTQTCPNGCISDGCHISGDYGCTEGR